MANAVKLIARGDIFTKVQNDDKQVCLSSSNDDDAQDLTDFKTALSLKASDLSASVVLVESTTYTATAEDTYILADDGEAGDVITITLPPVAEAPMGTVIHVKKIGSSDDVVVAADGSETIDGSADHTLTDSNQSVKLVSDGSAWYIFSNYDAA